MEDFLCINDVFSTKQKEIFKNLPIKGETYSLKEIVKSPIDGKIGLVFYELENPKHENGQEFSFRPSRFIPLNETRKIGLQLEKENYV